MDFRSTVMCSTCRKYCTAAYQSFALQAINIFTPRERSTMEGNNLTRACLLTGRGYPSQVPVPGRGRAPPSRSRWGDPILPNRGYSILPNRGGTPSPPPHKDWRGYPPGNGWHLVMLWMVCLLRFATGLSCLQCFNSLTVDCRILEKFKRS